MCDNARLPGAKASYGVTHDRRSQEPEPVFDRLGQDLPRLSNGCEPCAEPLIVDEADRLKTPALEQLSDHHDKAGADGHRVPWK